MPKWSKNLKSMIYQYVIARIITKNLLLNHQNWPNDQMVFGWSSKEFGTSRSKLVLVKAS
jgi:hypothetical protein